MNIFIVYFNVFVGVEISVVISLYKFIVNSLYSLNKSSYFCVFRRDFNLRR